MSTEAWVFAGTAFTCIFGSGGIVLRFLNRYAAKQGKMLERRIGKLEEGITTVCN